MPCQGVCQNRIVCSNYYYYYCCNAQLYGSPSPTCIVSQGYSALHLLHLPHQPVVLVFGHLQVIAQRSQTGILALQTALEIHHGLLQLAAVLPQRADLRSEGALLHLAELSLLRLSLQLGIHCSELSLKLRLLLESLEERTAWSALTPQLFLVSNIVSSGCVH